MTYKKINYELIEYATKNNLIKPFALFVYFKNNIKRSTNIYNFNYSKIAKLAHIHHKTAQRYINKLIEHKFCIVHHGNLLFRNQNKIAEDLNLELSIKRRLYAKNNLKDIIDKLYFALLKTKIVQQQHVGYQKLKNKSALSKTAFKKLYKKRLVRTYFSSRSIGRLFGSSHVFANEKIKKFEKQKLIKSEIKIKKLLKMPLFYFLSHKNELQELFKGYLFIKGKYLYEHEGRSILLNAVKAC